MRKECDLCGVTDLLVSEPHVQQLIDGLRAGQSRAVLGVPSAAHMALTAALVRALRVPILYVTAYPDRAMQMAQEFPSWLGPDQEALLFPALDALPYDRTGPERQILQQRLAVQRALASSDAAPAVIVAPARALIQPLMDPQTFQAQTVTLCPGDRFVVSTELARWENSGYTAAETVTAQGEYARRGGIIDVFPGDADEPIRIELFGDEIESLRRFDPDTQRSTDKIGAVTVAAVRQYSTADAHSALAELRNLDLSGMLPHMQEQWQEDLAQLEQGRFPEAVDLYAPYLLADPASLIDYLPARSLLVIDDPASSVEAMTEMATQAIEIRQELEGRGELPPGLRDPLLQPQQLHEQLRASHRVELRTRESNEASLEIEDWSEKRAFVPALTYAGRLRTFLDDTLELREDGFRVVVASLQSARLAELYDERTNTPGGGEPVGVADGVVDLPAPGSITLVQGALLEGWQAPGLGLYVFSDAEIFGWSKPAPIARFKREARVGGGLDFKPGDYVVHIEHGIGRYRGIEKRLAAGIEREYLDLQYAGTDRLFVPTDQLDRVTRYVGMGETAPVLSRLGTAEWTRAKARVKESVAKIASELLELYSYRQDAPGHAVAPDGRWQSEMEAAFPYVETIDQQRAIREVKADMESARPMDRLVCGDVGYGKTEVALRAAFKAVLDGQQVAVLVPTTILAQQHFQTFSGRMEAFPIRIAVLSRFQSRAEQKVVLKKLSVGEIDIVVGTHRLLQKDVSFKNLGLLVIDEEQRFGVKHKEYLKTLRRSVDVLTLTATPIPRSLHMALVGVRDMSVIETPPEGRLPIRTYLQPFDEYHVREAILRELDRGGQVYFVHNKVQTIQAVAERVRRLAPHARVAIAHGQMDEDELERVVSEFSRGEYDILVCSTIIENGLDIPNVNTMIVNDAPNFGLAQLYQLRGRIGRGSVRAYAYLLYRSEQRITRTAERRLRAIFEATDLGAGFRIAMKDLEIRGAGNLLGPEQSGTMATVGFDLYSRLLAQAIEERKRAAGALQEEAATASVDLPLDMYIPSDYVEFDNPRMALYQRLAAARDKSELDELADEMRDRFGALPIPVENLLYVVRVKVLASQSGLNSVALDENTLVLRGSEETIYDRISLYRRFGMDAKILRGSLRIPRRLLGDDWRDTLLTILEETVAANEPAEAGERRIGV